MVAELGMTRLIGVIAYGRSPRPSDGGKCGDTVLPNVATRVSTYSAWITALVGQPWREVAGVTGGGHTITGLANERQYRFYLSAVDALGRSSAPVVITATPRA